MQTDVRPTGTRRVALSCVVVLACSGCFGGGSLQNTSFFEPAPFNLQQVCPSISAVNDARDVVVFTPGERKIQKNVVYAGLILDAELSCDAEGETLQVSGEVEIMLEVGDANTDREVSAPFFIAITDLDSGKILSRRQFEAEYKFGRRSDTKVTQYFEEALDLSVPGAPTRTQALIGFQLTREQLEFNRRRRGTGAPIRASGELVGPLIAEPEPLPEPMFSTGPKIVPARAGSRPPPGLQTPEPPVPAAAPRVAVTGGALPAAPPPPTAGLPPVGVAVPTPTTPRERLRLPLAAPSDTVNAPPVTQTTTPTAVQQPGAAAQPGSPPAEPPAQRPILALPPMPVPTKN
ncbi:MAG: hypothetical protein QNJ92_08395 [Alphaproteobacteria bacterium]|nr:hypothetical protein [Alphaproteobacteria bacterium]